MTDSTGADYSTCKLTKESCPYRKITKSNTVTSTSNTVMQKSTSPMEDQHMAFGLSMMSMERCMQQLSYCHHTGSRRIDLPRESTRCYLKFFSHHMPCLADLLTDGPAAMCTGQKPLRNTRESWNRHSLRLLWATTYSLTMGDCCIQGTCHTTKDTIMVGYCLKCLQLTSRSGLRTVPRFPWASTIPLIHSSSLLEAIPTITNYSAMGPQFRGKVLSFCCPSPRLTCQGKGQGGIQLPQDYGFDQNFEVNLPRKHCELFHVT